MINSIDNKKIYLDEINLERQDNFNINSLELWNKNDDYNRWYYDEYALYKRYKKHLAIPRYDYLSSR